MDLNICPDSIPSFLKIFDLSVAPQLLYYAYVPIIVISLILGFFILIKDSYSLRSKLLFGIALSFSLWVINLMLQWTLVYINIDYFSWQITPFLEIFIPVLSIYFVYTFLYKKDVGIFLRLLFAAIIALVLIVMPTAITITSFDYQNCQANYGHIYDFVYTIEAATIVIISYICYRKFKGTAEKNEQKQAIILGVGSFFFTSLFFVTNLLGETTKIYQLNLFGPIGMLIFLALLTFMIVRYKAFNIKMFGAQALILSLVVVIGSEFFFITTDINRILTAGTLVITGVIGINLMRSVKKEIDQRKKIEELAYKVEVTNEVLKGANNKLKELDQLKSEFVSLATHQIRAPLSAIKGYLSEVFEGDFGPVNKELEKPLQVVAQSTENLVHIVDDFLNVSRIESGKMKYELATINLRQVVEDTVKALTPNLERAGLKLQVEISEKNYGVYADIGKIKQVIGNLVDNAIKYTPKGNIKISLSADDKTQKVLFAISDTGIGIPAEVIPSLFQKFTRGKGANEVNIIGTGLGLYVAKLMIEGQRGRIWAESAGAGKGSTFFIELPVAHVS